MLQRGDVLNNRYRIVKPLGQGAYGAVYAAQDLQQANRNCAVKELLDTFTDPAEQQEALRLFEREGELLSRLHHPSLPQIYDFFSVGSRHYLVMEFVSGSSLEEAIAMASTPIPLWMVEGWAIQLLEVLDYLHHHAPAPIIFRDLKPSNIMLTQEGNIKLVDFGIARLFNPAKKTDTVCLGTPGYAAPEQYPGSGRQSDARTDLYALGVILHQCLTLQDPAANPFQLPPVNSVNPSVPPAVSTLIEKATRLNPTDRFQNEDEFRHALTRAMGKKPIQLGTPPTLAKQKPQAPAAPTPASRAFSLDPFRPLLWLLYVNQWFSSSLQPMYAYNQNYSLLLFIWWWGAFFLWLEIFLALMTGALPQVAARFFWWLTLFFALLSRASLLRLGVAKSRSNLIVVLGGILLASTLSAKFGTPTPEPYSRFAVRPQDNSRPPVTLHEFQTPLYADYPAYNADTYIHGIWRHFRKYGMLLQIPMTDYRVEVIYLLPGSPMMTRAGLKVGASAKELFKLYGAPVSQQHIGETSRWIYDSEKMIVEMRDSQVVLIILAKSFNLIKGEYRTFLSSEGP